MKKIKKLKEKTVKLTALMIISYIYLLASFSPLIF